MPNLQRIAPELAVADVAKALEYYEARLGFRTVMTMSDGDYAIVERDHVEIHLFKSGKGNAPQSVHIFTEGIDALLAELLDRGAQIKQSLVLQPWGNRDFRVLDDSGNELKFTEPLAED